MKRIELTFFKEKSYNIKKLCYYLIELIIISVIYND